MQEQMCMSTSVQIEVEHVVAVKDKSEGKSEGKGNSKDEGKGEDEKDILQVQVHECKLKSSMQLHSWSRPWLEVRLW